MEMVLKDFSHAYNLKAIALRYFNPIGADPKMRSGIHVQNPSHVLGSLLPWRWAQNRCLTSPA